MFLFWVRQKLAGTAPLIAGPWGRGPGVYGVSGAWNSLSPLGYPLPVCQSCLLSLNYLPKGAPGNCNHCYQTTEAQIKPKGLKTVMIVFMSLCYHPTGQKVLAYATPFCPKLIQCLRTLALPKDHLFTLLLKDLPSPAASQVRIQ